MCGVPGQPTNKTDTLDVSSYRPKNGIVFYFLGAFRTVVGLIGGDHKTVKTETEGTPVALGGGEPDHAPPRLVLWRCCRDIPGLNTGGGSLAN